MDPNKRMNAWRKEMGYSTRQLEILLADAMKADYPDGFPSGVQVFQSDISDAENAVSEKKFEKVANAVYKYLGVEQGSFGQLIIPNKKDSMILSKVREALHQTEVENFKLEIKRLEKTIADLNTEKIDLLKRCWELEAQLKPKE